MLTFPCPCGAIALAIQDAPHAPLAQFFCHCDDCRKMTSGAYAAESVYRQDAVTVTRGTPAVWTLQRNPALHRDRGAQDGGRERLLLTGGLLHAAVPCQLQVCDPSRA